ncbi:MAG: SGNH/GDSL hydrolase family protein [Clostridia bacterium]|nr:SGNH/GDSL hydrolase family protein [Clostridia bacterium]
MNNVILFSDLAKQCAPYENISDARPKDKWYSCSYETKEVNKTMRLNTHQIGITITGAAAIKDINGKICVSRFTQEQRQLYKNRDCDSYLRSLSSAGIKMSFSTNSKNLFIRTDVAPGSSRKFFSFDIYMNEKCIGHLDNFDEIHMPQKYSETNHTLEPIEKSFDLGTGVKDITIYFPWSVNCMIEEISLDDGAFIHPQKRRKTLLAFGDSITQGYDAMRPSATYVSKLARALNADEFNKGIGGETFFPDLALTKESFIPDYITVAYGTNDWVKSDKHTFENECRDFFVNLRNTYKQSEIYAITPIWRTDVNETKTLGTFREIEETISKCAEPLNICVVHGLPLVPHDSNDFYADFYVHPNDTGFDHFYKNLYNEILLRKGD